MVKTLQDFYCCASAGHDNLPFSSSSSPAGQGVQNPQSSANTTPEPRSSAPRTGAGRFLSPAYQSSVLSVRHSCGRGRGQGGNGAERGPQRCRGFSYHRVGRGSRCTARPRSAAEESTVDGTKPAILCGKSPFVASQNGSRWEGPLKAARSRSPVMKWGTCSSTRCLEPIRPDLGCLQGWGTHHISEQPEKGDSLRERCSNFQAAKG
ncbi:uncharacterized protein LOC116217079 [Meleagris gallopavo]|uniref:uncharacterized protein LOC116217079 n=1 Tax=Meleagris gallopavo TaxID=9103 RepID=UPI0012AB6FEF|nr:uncharacterized protein LOC116217079 [Meleagris gallopavo]